MGVSLEKEGILLPKHPVSSKICLLAGAAPPCCATRPDLRWKSPMGFFLEKIMLRHASILTKESIVEFAGS